MKRWMYALENDHIVQLQAFFETLSARESAPLSLRELLRSTREEAFGILLRDLPEEQFPDLLRFTESHRCSVAVFCRRRMGEETLHLMHRSQEITLLPEASYLKELVHQNHGDFIKAQAVFLNLPWDDELQELLRACRTRVVLVKDPKLLSEVAAGGFFCIPVVSAGETHTAKASVEISLKKTPLFTVFPLAPRVAMMRNVQEILTAGFTRRYSLPDNRYNLSAQFPLIIETVRQLPEDPSSAFENAFRQGYGILLKQDDREDFFLYGIHGDTGCYLAMDENWETRLLSRQGLERMLQKEQTVTLLRVAEKEASPTPRIFEEALKDEMPSGGEQLYGRTAAVTFLNVFSRGERTDDPLSLRLFMEERFLIAEALKWFAKAESLYIDKLESHLTLLEKQAVPILNHLRGEAVEITPSRRLQWGEAMHRIFNSEELCLRQCIEERQRMATYLRWAKELRKKS